MNKRYIREFENYNLLYELRETDEVYIIREEKQPKEEKERIYILEKRYYKDDRDDIKEYKSLVSEITKSSKEYL